MGSEKYGHRVRLSTDAWFFWLRERSVCRGRFRAMYLNIQKRSPPSTRLRLQRQLGKAQGALVATVSMSRDGHWSQIPYPCFCAINRDERRASVFYRG